jgi:transposase
VGVTEADPRDARIAELEAEVAELKQLLSAALARIAQQDARIAELEAKLGQNSRNSSKPPSSDPPGTQRSGQSPTGRKPGGQVGHKGSRRELLPLEQVDRVIDVLPERCGTCQEELLGRDQTPFRHQVTEIPPVRAEVTEYRCHKLECGHCGNVTVGKLPREVDGQMFGERLSGMASLMVGKYRMSKRLVQDALSDFTGVEMSLGAISAREQEMSATLQAPAQEAQAYVREQVSANADETGWTEGKAEGRAKRAWLWVLATPLVCVFRIAASRGSEIAKELLGDFAGILTTDRWCGYNWFDLGLRQLCWSHLTRDFQAFIDRGGAGARIGRALMRQRHRMFNWWHRVRDGTLTREVFHRRMCKVELKVGCLLREAAVCPDQKTAGTAREILRLEQAMWTFVDVPGIEPTNNFGERIVRPSVMYRKTSFGTQSPGGSRFVERILTAVMTLKLQRRNVLEYLTDALRAHRRGLPAPSLLPEADSAQLALAA